MTSVTDPCSQCQGDAEDGGGVGKLELTHVGRAKQTLLGPESEPLVGNLRFNACSSGETRGNKSILLFFKEYELLSPG